MAAEEETRDATNHAGPRRSNGAQAPSNDAPSAKRAPRRPPENAILAGRGRRHARPKADPAAPTPENAKAETLKVAQADSDPWTVPESVRDRFVQDGHRFYFPDGAPRSAIAAGASPRRVRTLRSCTASSRSRACGDGVRSR